MSEVKGTEEVWEASERAVKRGRENSERAVRMSEKGSVRAGELVRGQRVGL